MTDLSLELLRRQRDEAIENLRRLQASGGDGTYDDMERRVTKLEDKVDKLIDRATAVEIALATLAERVAHLPGKGFIVGSTIATLSIVAGLIAFAEKLQQLVH